MFCMSPKEKPIPNLIKISLPEKITSSKNKKIFITKFSIAEKRVSNIYILSHILTLIFTLRTWLYHFIIHIRIYEAYEIPPSELDYIPSCFFFFGHTTFFLSSKYIFYTVYTNTWNQWKSLLVQKYTRNKKISFNFH